MVKAGAEVFCATGAKLVLAAVTVHAAGVARPEPVKVWVDVPTVILVVSAPTCAGVKPTDT